MTDIVNSIVTAPAATIFILGGLFFLAIAIIGRVSGKIDPGPWGRVSSGLLGSMLLIMGISYLNQPSSQPAPPTNTSVSPSPPTMIPTNTPVPTLTSSPTASLRILSFYNQLYKTEDEYPGVPFDIQSHGRVSGKTDFVWGHNKHVWYALCPQTIKKCTLKEINLYPSGEWNILMDIGSDGNECAIFDVIFVVVNDATNAIFKNFDEPYSLTEIRFEAQEFEAHIPFAVRPVLDDDKNYTALCQTVSG